MDGVQRDFSEYIDRVYVHKYGSIKRTPVYNCARVYNDCTVTLGRSKVSYNVCGHSLIHYDSINVEIELLKFMEQFQIVYCFAKAVCSS
ncbi:hypothetical protein F2P81_000440 [Scophthalmus maximus]|uniref:Uncharacterized protein n=1 Tax=Scophthalmus maximus TaxID=52904 RepID=A0A6A4TJ58_SCOMX|nr:hypothetical protein F2P81_000440 [Scophthalmus maximus]